MPLTEENAEKQRLRAALACRALPAEERRQASARITDAVLNSSLYQRARSVFVYVSMPTEPDTAALLRHALDSGKAVYVPKCCPPHRMEAVRICSLEGLKPGVWGIPEPVRCAETAACVDLALVPCVAASRDGRRLGHGAGYYDGWLSRVPAVSICLCFEEMLTDGIPMDARDRWMDYVATERGLFSCKNT